MLLAYAVHGTANAADGQPVPAQQSVRGVDPQSFLGEWRDGQDRYWFTVNAIENNVVTDAHFRLAHLVEGHIEGNVLTLVSESCVPILGCFVYTHTATLTAPGVLDMFGHSENCRFWHECREGEDIVNQELTRR
jgi:hypothetical protein